MSKKSLIIIVVVIVVAGVVYLASRSSNPGQTSTPITEQSGNEVKNQNTIDTSNWKMYTNKKYGFTFKYPFSEKLEEAAGTSGTLEEITINSPSSFDSGLGSGIIIHINDRASFRGTDSKDKTKKIGNYEVIIQKNIFSASEAPEAVPDVDAYLVVLKNVVLEMVNYRAEGGGDHTLDEAIISTLREI
ncbi:MAG: hypothetical protein A3H70_02015 [Candidatus Komeilibacteria bacterium RIFCSPLOWO2_02_FULL_48_11]|uniref:Uncharacterized protein n=1 Tax=Candidatus Komeilibacteria bacterium RIFCSPLOWO2_02_FULL_48_11 TaxID=1798553 RepID=A0A1G2BS80_9BACT|nr:MAG: hypothetical protein A3H70_02015 [Candidatus Komeilibacteria bacterium RIFCSPLOWO2_02_FULL_48_11]